MEQNFETSFIPKKPIVKDETRVKRPVGLLTVGSVLVFITAAAAFGGLTIYKKNLEASLADKAEQITIARNQFEPERIRQLEILGRRLSATRSILNQHIAVTPIFEELAKITRKQVAYTDFSYTVEGATGVRVRLKGIAEGYRQVALQSDLFGENRNFREPVFSNLSLNERGNVLFDLEFTVDPAFVDYRQMIERQDQAFDYQEPLSFGGSGVLPAQ